MKLQVLSDLHVEFAPFALPETEVSAGPRRRSLTLISRDSRPSSRMSLCALFLGRLTELAFAPPLVCFAPLQPRDFTHAS
jgi:hypothetical protein